MKKEHTCNIAVGDGKAEGRGGDTWNKSGQICNYSVTEFVNIGRNAW